MLRIYLNNNALLKIILNRFELLNIILINFPHYINNLLMSVEVNLLNNYLLNLNMDVFFFLLTF